MSCVLAAREDPVASRGWRGEAAPWSSRAFGGVRRGAWEQPLEREGLREAAMAAVEEEMGGHGSTKEGWREASTTLALSLSLCVRRCFFNQSPHFACSCKTHGLGVKPSAWLSSAYLVYSVI